jgi:broad specificity phosphatase PhoE
MGKVTKRTLLLVRSGPTEWDLAGRLQGQADLPLAPNAQSATEGWTPTPGISGPVTVFSAPDEACRIAAKALVDASGAKLNISEDLRELDLGLWSGLRIDELETRFERAGTQWLDDPASITIPEGEPFQSMEVRLLGVIEKAISKRRTSTSIAVVLRPIAYSLVRCRLEQLPTAQMRRYFDEPNPPAPLWFEVDKDDVRLIQDPLDSRLADQQAPAA